MIGPGNIEVCNVLPAGPHAYHSSLNGAVPVLLNDHEELMHLHVKYPLHTDTKHQKVICLFCILWWTHIKQFVLGPITMDL